MTTGAGSLLTAPCLAFTRGKCQLSIRGWETHAAIVAEIIVVEITIAEIIGVEITAVEITVAEINVVENTVT